MKVLCYVMTTAATTAAAMKHRTLEIKKEKNTEKKQTNYESSWYILLLNVLSVCPAIVWNG